MFGQDQVQTSPADFIQRNDRARQFAFERPLEIDALREKGVRSRGAFLSEMLCLRFPDLYPVKNEPVEGFLAAIKFKGPRGASEGVAYVDLAQRLRMTLRANPKHPAKNIAELDAVLWLAYGKNSPGLE